MVYRKPRRTPVRQIINTEHNSARPTESPDDLTRIVIINDTLKNFGLFYDKLRLT